jgi:hypothetical protein
MSVALTLLFVGVLAVSAGLLWRSMRRHLDRAELADPRLGGKADPSES